MDFYKIYVIKYFFKRVGSDELCYRIVSDLREGHERFVESLRNDDKCEKLAYEYLSEYDCVQLGVCKPIFDKTEVNNNEKV